MTGCAPHQLFARCPPTCGTPVLPMRSTPNDDLRVVLSEATGKSFVVEQRYAGERVQIHRLGDCVAVYGRDLQDMGRHFSSADMDSIRTALKVKSCVLDAVMLRDGEGLFFVVFDCLWFQGRALTRHTLRERHCALGRAA